jgi:transcriptional regulator with XRE-family HTH domain
MDIHSRVAAWRKSKGWTQRQLAEAVGVTVSAVWYWEAGKTKPAKYLDKLVEVLGVSMAEFYGDVPGAPKAKKSKKAAA